LKGRLVLFLGLLAVSAARAGTFQLKIIALNDFHGNLQSPGIFRANAQSPEVPAGGADYLAGYVAYLKAQNPDNVVVSAGDLTGASPLISALFHDEGTIEAMNRLGLEINAVGNHEFDKGKRELLRLQRGGCSKLDANTCGGTMHGTPAPFAGAKVQYLAANVVDTSTGKTIFPAYTVKTYRSIKVAFIGLTLEDTPAVVTAAGVAGLRFADEAGTINTTGRGRGADRVYERGGHPSGAARWRSDVRRTVHGAAVRELPGDDDPDRRANQDRLGGAIQRLRVGRSGGEDRADLGPIAAGIAGVQLRMESGGRALRQSRCREHRAQRSDRDAERVLSRYGESFLGGGRR
jgi:hypothetical protein